MVVFDLGGVIMRICRSFTEACDRAGLELRPGAEAPAMSARRKLVAEAYHVGAITCDEFFAGLSRATDDLYSPAEVRRIHDAWLIEDYPGVGALVHDLHARGVATGILSNTNHAHWVRMGTREFPAGGLVQHPHASHLLRLAKPHEAIYRRFHESTARVAPRCADGAPRSPAQLLFFDDLQENIAAARGCGWNAHQIDHTGDTAAQMRAELHRRAVL
jgi:FMN phosphatase YigB (HAD superfamily)